MTNDADWHPSLPTKIVLGIIAVLIISGIVYFVWSGSESWRDTGKVSWVSVGQKTFTEDQGIAFWYTPYSFAIATSSHGIANFTDPHNQHPCSYCAISPTGLPKMNQTIGLVKHNNGNYDLYLDP